MYKPEEIDEHERELELAFHAKLYVSMSTTIGDIMADLRHQVPCCEETVDRVLELGLSASDIQLNVYETNPRRRLEIIAGVQKKALEVDEHLPFHLSDSLDRVYAILLDISHLVCSRLPTTRRSSSSVGFRAPMADGKGIGTCEEDKKLKKETPILSDEEHVQPEEMHLILLVSQKLVSLKSHLNGSTFREDNGENRDRVRKLLAMLADCNISPYTNKTMKIIDAVLEKSLKVEEQLPRQFQARMREVHEFLLDVKCSLTPPSEMFSNHYDQEFERNGQHWSRL